MLLDERRTKTAPHIAQQAPSIFELGDGLPASQTFHRIANRPEASTSIH
jgi:hypothetical protein